MTVSIKQVAQESGVSEHTLRFYEKEGILPFVKRNEHGNRIYGEQNFEWIYFITSLRKRAYLFPRLSGMRNYLSRGIVQSRSVSRLCWTIRRKPRKNWRIFLNIWKESTISWHHMT